MCGESTISRLAPASNRGSPPHVWGKLCRGYSQTFGQRITPTCVGKALRGSRKMYKSQDHPHMCGESYGFWFVRPAGAGSPPHVWGKQSIPTGSRITFRITPTCVGKAALAKDIYDVQEDHPHMCGESWMGPYDIQIYIGSPPHVWGKPDVGGQKFGLNRITPTCVGKALKDPSIGAIFKLQEHVF